VEDRSGGRASSSSTYYVQRGDTLYSIAFRYGLDYRKVAAANRIPAPYIIYPGQRITLREAPVPVAATSARPKPKTGSASSTTRTSPPAPVATTSPAIKSTPVTKSSSSAAKKSSPYTGSSVGAWRWPSSGRVIRGYSATVHKGIDIAGKRGDPVKAVAAGKVVYAGTGIVGFGELLIVKHNDVYLSAYGHNDRLLVAEDDVVTAGQTIAEKGSSGTDRVKLHFEIRKEGKPVDPQRLLPRR
jgi:lipoprotein NlpD